MAYFDGCQCEFYDEFSFPIRVARLALLTGAWLRVKRNEICRVQIVLEWLPFSSLFFDK